MKKDYKLNLARYAKQAFDALTPHEQRVLRQMMADDPVFTPAEIEADSERWAKRMKRISEENRPKSELLDAITKRAKASKNN